MEDGFIPISFLNDFIFCPCSIYFHQLYGDSDDMLYKETVQLNGAHAHKSIDSGTYSNKAAILQSLPVLSVEHGLYGKIDIFDANSGSLVERKNHISKVYDGQIFQLYGEYFGLKELGYNVKRLTLHSLNDNIRYNIRLPEDEPAMLSKFLDTIRKIKEFDISVFRQTSANKCANCIYEPACDRSVL